MISQMGGVYGPRFRNLGNLGPMGCRGLRSILP